MAAFLVFGAVLYATMLAVVAFFVLFAAARAEGRIRTFGNVLGVWVLVLAGLVLICAALAPFVAGRYGPGMIGGAWYGRMHDWRGYPGGYPGRQALPSTSPESQKPAQ
jgi:hypothetical protein